MSVIELLAASRAAKALALAQGAVTSSEIARLQQPLDALIAPLAQDAATFPWYMSTQPNALYLSDANKTVIVYETLSLASVRRAYSAVAFNHATKAVEGPYALALDSDHGDDDHGVPSIVRDHQGYLHVFGGGHYGPSLWTCSSNAPDDISATTARTTISGKLCYPHPFAFGTSLGLIVRDDRSATAGSGMTMAWYKTTALDLGVLTWGSEKILVDLGSDTRCYPFSVEQHPKTGEQWILACRANDANTYLQDVLLFRLDPVTGNLRNIGSSNVAPGSQPIGRAFAESSFRIVNQATSGRYGASATAAFDRDGNYHFIYMDTATLSSSATSLDILYQVYDGASFSAPVKIGTASNYKCGMSLLAKRDGTLRAYWSSKEAGQPFNRSGSIFEAVRSAAGVWSAAQVIATPTAYQLDNPVIVKNGRDDMSMVYCECVTVPEGTGDGGKDFRGGGVGFYGYGSKGLVTRYIRYRPQTKQFIDRLSAAPSDETVRRYDAMIRRLVDAGIWADIDGFYMFAAAPNEEAALINLKGDRFNLRKYGGLTFTQGRGYQGDGTSGYLDTGFNPSIAALSTMRWQQNSAHMALYSLTDAQSANADMGFPQAPGYQANDAALTIRNVSNQFTARLNAGGTTSVTPANPNGIGLFVARRTAAQVFDLYRNGERVTQDTTTPSNAPANSNLTILRYQSSYSARQIACASFGGGIADASTSRAKMAILNAALYRALYEVGAVSAALSPLTTLAPRSE